MKLLAKKVIEYWLKVVKRIGINFTVGIVAMTVLLLLLTLLMGPLALFDLGVIGGAITITYYIIIIPIFLGIFLEAGE